MGAKIRNTHKVGGERVKEMQFFIQSVETPGTMALFILEPGSLLINSAHWCLNRGESQASRYSTTSRVSFPTTSLSSSEPTVTKLQGLMAKMKHRSVCEASGFKPVMIGDGLPLHVQDKYLPLSNEILAHAHIFYRLLEIICCEIYTHGMVRRERENESRERCNR